MNSKKPKKTVVKLDYAKAAKKAAKGATAVNVALAAGSKAKGRRALSAVGLKIIERLATRGQVFETFNELGYGVRRFAEQVIKQTEAIKVSRYAHMGEVVTEIPDPDFAARTAAREQYMRAIGLTELPALGTSEPAGPLSDWSTDDLTRALQEFAEGPAAPGPAS